jgi:hypothetical protein
VDIVSPEEGIGENKGMGTRRTLQSLRKGCITLFATVARPIDGGPLFVDIGLRIILMTRAVLWSKISFSRWGSSPAN